MAKRKDDATDAEEFNNAMADVTPLPPDPRGREHSRPPTRTPRAAAASPADDDSEGPDHAFAVSGVDRRTIKRLKRGDYPAQGRQDLHGLTAADACATAGRFIAESLHCRHRCVCIVHGRGLHSEGRVPILKAGVRAYLRSHPSVLAYADAPHSDGGQGAVYILLRK